MSRTKKIARFHVLLTKLQMKSQKESILHGYGVDSTKSLTDKQLDSVIDRLVEIENKKTSETEQIVRRERSKILRQLDRMGISTMDGWERVNAYLCKPRIAGKMLYEMSLEELQACHKKLCAIARKETTKKELNNRLAKNN